MEQISKETLIEDLLQILPTSVNYLMDRGIRCMRCGEPMWGTLEKACTDKGFTQDEIAVFVNDLNGLLTTV
ncbi:MAG: DUF1858 domain-containing protein [Ignavibacteriales bacterium]|nr:DUF1858 domain-containing protein [Ignavibacteriales bacterium]